MSFPAILFISGPTAVGKSSIAFEFAKRHNGEIVSCDAMQVYREVSIVSNKPQAANILYFMELFAKDEKINRSAARTIS